MPVFITPRKSPRLHKMSLMINAPKKITKKIKVTKTLKRQVKNLSFSPASTSLVYQFLPPPPYICKADSILCLSSDEEDY
jgi:hypothetical protein